jgi:hypothetical protein
MTFIQMGIVVYRSVQCIGRLIPCFIAEVWCQSQTSRCGIYGGQSGTDTVLLPSTSVLPSQYYLTSAPYSYPILCDQHCLTSAVVSVVK